MGKIKIALVGVVAVVSIAVFAYGSALAAGVRVVPSTMRALPGDNFYVDVVAEGIPAEGLGGVQFRLNVAVPGGTVTGVSDLGQAGASEVAVATPLLVSQATATRSGIGDFFWNGRGGNGILVMDNEPLTNGSSLYTFAHTNGATPPSGSGSVARFMVRVGTGVNSKLINIGLTDVMLLDGGPFYPLDSNNGATVQIGCFTRVPDLLGLSLAGASVSLAQAQLLLGTTHEIDNPGGSRPLNVVLEQSAPAGSELLCEAPVSLALNTAPAEVTGGSATDKPGDDSGAALVSWNPSQSADTAGYRIYLGNSLLRDILNPAANGAEIGGLATGVTSQLRVSSYDTHGNESQGVTIAATPLDDVAPVIIIGGVTEGAYYRSDVTPQVSVTDTNLAGQTITLNGNLYTLLPITADGANNLTVTGADRFGNQTTKVVHFTLDKTPPAITVASVADGGAYNTNVTPVITVTDANLKGSSATLNGQPYASGTAVTAEGEYSLTLAAEDLAGNTANLTARFIVDKTPPVCSADAAAPRYASGGVLFVSHQTPIAVNAQDSGVAPSGVAGIEYRLDGAQAWGALAAPVAFAGLADGVHTLNYRAFDRAANLENSHPFTVTVDNTPPESLLAVGIPKFTDASGATFATRETLFTVSAMDNLSGVANTQLQMESSPWAAYASFTLSGEGVHSFRYKSLDNLTNEETAKSFSVTIDNSPPVTGIAAGTSQYAAPDGTLYISGSTPVTLAATDNASGVTGSFFKVDGGAPATYQGAFTVAGAGSHTICYYSVDRIGNREPERTWPVTVDTAPPQTVITVGSPKYVGATLYVKGTTAFTLAATDDRSGVALTEYRIDNGPWTAYSPFIVAAEGTHVIYYRSSDRVGNQEEEKTLVIFADDTPPTSGIIIGSPKFQEGGPVYIASATSFVIASADAGSGVEMIEYRVDGGQWFPYASFAIATEGEHVIGFRSSDNLGNQETEKVLTVIVDNAPPVSLMSVGSPNYFANGNIYVSGRTEFSISAADGACGVKGSEYAIGKGAFTSYGAPFNLAHLPDGGHDVAYRSVDNLNNIETAKQLDTILDKTPPTSVIAASDPLATGVVNTVSPKTTFSLAATDNLSGVKGIWYRIDGGQWQLFAEGFTLAGFGVGAHAISFSASDNVGNDEAERIITVRLALAEMKKELSLEPVVLVGAWTDNLNKVRNQGAIDSLKTILTSLDINFYIAANGDDFKGSLRSGRYTTYLLIDYKDEKVGEELREAVNYGDGLIFIKTRPTADPALDEVFGVKFNGMTTDDNLPVNLLESPLSAAGSLASSGKSVVAIVEEATAQVFGSVDDKKSQYPSVVFNGYGSGKVLLFTFDLLGSADKEKVADLVASSINLLKPDVHKVRALASIPVRITVVSSAEPLGLQVVETIPAGTTADAIIPQGIATDTGINWQQHLETSTKAQFSYYLNLPDAKGEYMAATEVRYSNFGDYRIYDTLEMTATVRSDSTDLLQGVIAELNSIQVTASSDLSIVTEAVNILSSIDFNPRDGNGAEMSVESVTKVANLIRGLSANNTDIRLMLDELLKILERKWYLISSKIS